MDFNDLIPEVQEKLKACKTEEELNTLCEELGKKLSLEELQGIAGGSTTCHKDDCIMNTCPINICNSYSGGCPHREFNCPSHTIPGCNFEVIMSG